MWHHGKCRYKLLRNLACPSKVGVRISFASMNSMRCSYRDKKTDALLIVRFFWYDPRICIDFDAHIPHRS